MYCKKILYIEVINQKITIDNEKLNLINCLISLISKVNNTIELDSKDYTVEIGFIVTLLRIYDITNSFI